MTINEALEYLNLPSNPDRQLIRKRYLELKNNYLKAIYNAPSDHFSSLYQENLRKIEESYSLLIEGSEGFNDSESRIQQTIMQTQQVVNSFLDNRKVLDSVAQEKIKNYIDRIDRLKDSLQKNLYDYDPAAEKSTGKDQSRPGWYWETDKLKQRYQVAKTIQPTPQPVKSESQQTSENMVKWINRIMTPFPETTWGRRYFYDRLLMVVIITILILGIIGGLYVIFPLMFSR